MPETSPAEPAAYPTRRSLRTSATHTTPEASSQDGPGIVHPEAPVATTGSPAPAAEPAPNAIPPSSAPTAQLGAEDVAGPTNADAYVRVPVREHQPASIATATTGAPPRRRSLRHRIAAVTAAASVGGLFMTVAVPLFQESDATDTAAAAQKLFSEVSAADVPDTLSEITAVDVDEAIVGTYAYRPRAIVNYPFTSPVLLTDPFGYRTAPVEQFHDAQDFGAGAGTPINAIADGVVLEAGSTTDGCGFGLKLEHEIDGDTVTSRYCHMQDASHSYQVGDTIKMGDPAGKVGATGMAFGAHLHLALRVNDKPVDPMPFFSKYTRIDRDETSTGKTGGRAGSGAATATDQTSPTETPDAGVPVTPSTEAP